MVPLQNSKFPVIASASRRRSARQGFAGAAIFVIAVCPGGCDGAKTSEAGNRSRPASEPHSRDASTQAEWVSFVDQSSWAAAPLEDDPLADHQPSSVECDIAGWRVEDGLLEIDTGRCDYLWLGQPAVHAIPAGASVTLELRHFDLTSVQPAEAHVALLFGTDVAWETTIGIPAKGNVLSVEWRTDQPHPEGERVGLHLHNHGQNTWSLVSAKVRVEGK